MTSKRNSILILLMIVLLIANTIFTGVLWFRQHSRHEPVDNKTTHGQRNPIFSDFIGFDSIQQITFDSLFDQHHQKMRMLKEKERAAKSSLFNLLKSDTASDATVQFYANQASTISMQIDTLTYFHFKKIKSICKPEQMSRLSDFFENHFLHQKENNPNKLDSNSTNKEDRKDMRRMPPPNGRPDRLRPDGTPPPPPRDGMNEDGPPPPPPGRRMGHPGEHRPPHDGPPPPDRRPPGPPPVE
jgi:Tfp pilus assembly protein PilV